MIVLKFGGRTIGTAEGVSRCLDLIAKRAGESPLVVVSAHGNTTDMLVDAASRALKGEIKSGAIRRYHEELADDLSVPRTAIDPLLTRLETLLHGINLVKELTVRTMDNVMSFGERLSSRIIAGALNARGMKASAINSYDAGMLTDSAFGNAKPLPGMEKAIAAAIGSVEGIPVVTGFLGKNDQGEITTLGRSGSDYTATIFAAAVKAKEVVIYKAVDGVMTADPGIEPGARNIPKLSFDEASELAYFGAEVLHPATLIPAIRHGIPVRVANVMRHDDPGTVIVAEPVLTKSLAKSIAYKEDVTLIHLESERFHSVPEILNSALAVLKDHGVIAHMIMTSEAGISLITQSGLSERARNSACEGLKGFASVRCEDKMAVVCVVGDELRGNPKSIGRIFTALADAGVCSRAITKSASEINVAFLVKDSEIANAVKSLHSIL
ncbi:MAG: aspartate kinase [bacterium]